MIKRLLASNIGPVTRASYKLADPLLFVGKVFWGNKVLGKPGMLFEHREQLGTLVFRKQAKGNCGDQVMPAFQAKQSWLGGMKRGIRKRAISRLSGFVGGILLGFGILNFGFR